MMSKEKIHNTRSEANKERWKRGDFDGLKKKFSRGMKKYWKNHPSYSPRTGKKHTEKTKRKMRLSAKKTIHTQEWNAKISKGKLGKKFSEKHLNAIREGQKKAWKKYFIKKEENLIKNKMSIEDVGKTFEFKTHSKNWGRKNFIGKVIKIYPQHFHYISNNRLRTMSYGSIQQKTEISPL